MNSELSLDKMLYHVGHELSMVTYGDVNVSLECETCNELLQDCDIETKDF